MIQAKERGKATMAKAKVEIKVTVKKTVKRRIVVR